MKKPVIGITLDWEAGGGYSAMPHYALRQNYADAVSRAGGIPLMLPHHPELVDDTLTLLDGLIITGGNFDIDPSYYGGGAKHPTVTTKDHRTTFELAITRKALAKNLPILGICGGEQLLNVLLGGTLIQHIPDSVENALEHEHKPHTAAGHTIAITTNTLFHRIVGEETMAVNSTHHQAVATVGNNVTIAAIAPDGVIEAIEYTNHPFCIGVQWHPEYEISAGDSKLFTAFIKSAIV